jgi:hypothetical protein
MLVREGTIMQRISWTGVLTGVFLGLVTLISLLLLGLAIGLVSVSNLSNIGGAAITAAIWFAISWGAAAFVAGLSAARAAGYLSTAQGRFNGLLTGAVLFVVSSIFTISLISSVVNSVTGTARDIVGTAASAVGGAAGAAGGSVAQNGGLEGTLRSLGLGDAFQSVTSGLDNDSINQLISDASPELNQTQVAAATGVVRGIVNNASRDLSGALANPADLPGFVTKRVEAVTSALSGADFTARLQRRGLSQAQAREVSAVIGKRVAELRTQGEQAAKVAADSAAQLARDAANTAGKAAWAWLFFAGLVMGLSAFGGGMGGNINPRELDVNNDGTAAVIRTPTTNR